MSDWQFKYNINVDERNQVVYVKIFGVWKEDTAQRYHEDFKAETEAIIDKPWAKLIDLINWKMGTPEAINILGEHMDWSRKNGMKVQTYVINDPVRYGQLLKMIDKGKAKEVSKTFRTRAEAERFLKAEGFKVISS